MNLKGLNENLLYTIFPIVNVSVHLSHGLKKPPKMAKIIFFRIENRWTQAEWR